MQKAQGFVENGNLVVTVSGVSAAQKAQGSYPQATVTIYNAGTLVLATIYSDNSLTAKANPFTAQTNGYFFFYAANGRYDITFSGGGLSAPLTFGDFLLADPFASGGAVTSFNGRTGAVVPATNDYTTAQISGFPVATAGLQYFRTKNATPTVYEFANEPVYNSASYDFALQAPAENLSPVLKTVTLARVPDGINGGNTLHYLGIYNNAGTWQENVLINGGSAVSGGTTGTVIFSSIAGTYAAGAYKIGSATSGVQEAMWATGGSGRVLLAAGAVQLYAHVTFPLNYAISLRGMGEGATTIRCHGTTGDWVHAQAGSAYIDIGDFSIVNHLGVFHTSGSTVRISYKVYGVINNIEVEHAFWGITTEACSNVQPHNCIVGASKFCYYITSLGVAYPTAQQSSGMMANCYGSMTSLAGAVFEVEGPCSGLELIGNVGICNTNDPNNRVLQIVYSSALGGQEMAVIGGVYDAGGTGILLVGDGVAYPTFFYVFSGVECSGSEFGFAADSKMANIHWSGGLIKAANGATQQSLFLRTAKNCRFSDVDMECLGSSAITVEDVTDILLDSVVVGKNGTTPTNALAFNGAATRFVLQNSDFGACSTKIANPNLATSPLKLVNNIGVDDVIPAVASAATLVLPVNPDFTITGAIVITAITSYLVAGSRGTLMATSGPLYFVASGSIGNTVALAQNVAHSWLWDGTKLWINRESGAVIAVAAATNSTSSIGSTVLLTAPTAGIYRVTWALNTGSVSGGTGTSLVTIGWTDGVGAKTSAGAALTLTAAANQSGSVLVNVASGNLTYATTYAAGSGGNYNLQVAAELVN